ncbi:uncharacterized protein CIMG_04004 [Coccidioides immitis RS]|uniref:Uncharacterized protein n=1 Tax=Coccidioides immitis (strain RS) TaxID=246410 RepID=J3KCK6_COCIM|nr:uncharacterized protein CIMG_04004 [Coccidioides immitis RS]EAS32980.3 hypothetical protein CIMG_04004 [Coccidioides immitis RS]
MDGCVGNGKKSWMETGYNLIRRKSLNITSPSHQYGVHIPVDTKVAESGLGRVPPAMRLKGRWIGINTTSLRSPGLAVKRRPSSKAAKVDVWIEPKRSSCAHKLPLGPLFCFLGLPLLPNPKIHFSDGKSGLYRLPSFPVPRTLYQRDPVST